MKKTLVRIILATLMLVTGGSTPVLGDGGNPRPPYCYPGIICG
ncbi:MAG TPA: hypothetical protein VI685_16680 [Candidatus Angelobacter sp.]